MPNSANLGFESRFAFQSTGTAFDVTAPRFEVVSSTVKKTTEVLDSAGLLGTRSRREDRSRFGVIRVGGQLVFDVSPRMLDFFLPYIMGATESTDTYSVADGLPGFDMLQDPYGTGTAALKFTELYVNRMTLRPNAGLMRMTLDVAGKTFLSAQTFSSAALGATAAADAPYTFYDTASGVTIRSGSGTQEIEDFELSVDNALDIKSRNSQTVTSIRATDRTVSLVATLPHSATILSTYFGDKAAADATIVMTNGTVATTFTLNNFKVADEGPETAGKDEVPLVLHGMARGDGTDAFDISTTVVGSSL